MSLFSGMEGVLKNQWKKKVENKTKTSEYNRNIWLKWKENKFLNKIKKDHKKGVKRKRSQ